MNSIGANINKIKEQLPAGVTLIAVSKTKPVDLLQQAYEAGMRHFGENKVQEMCSKQPLMPADVHWHLIGHLQSNKVKYIAPFVHLIHSVDSLKLLEEINKQGAKNNRVIDCLLQVFIATEETKFGLDETEVRALLGSTELAGMTHVRLCGLMGMASNTANEGQVKLEFTRLKELFNNLSEEVYPHTTMQTLSMGMSSDYALAVSCGSNMIRVGSSIFGERNYAV